MPANLFSKNKKHDIYDDFAEGNIELDEFLEKLETKNKKVNRHKKQKLSKKENEEFHDTYFNLKPSKPVQKMMTTAAKGAGANDASDEKEGPNRLLDKS